MASISLAAVTLSNAGKDISANSIFMGVIGIFIGEYIPRDKYWMLHYKIISWPTILASQILGHIMIEQPDLERVAPLSKPVQETIMKELSVNLDLCSLYRIMLVYVPAGKKLSIHSDRTTENLGLDKLGQSVFLPLSNCNNLHWSWFKCIDSEKIFYYKNEGNWNTVPMLPHDAATEIDTIVGNNTMITDIATWHSLRNDGNDPAVALSIRLMPWSWEDFGTCTALPPLRNVIL